MFIAYQKHTHEEDDNLAACKILADEEGWNCVLLPATSSSKSPDMINANDGRFWEIKTNRRGTISSLDNELRAAKDQSKNVIVRFDMNYIGSLNRNDMESAGKRRIKREGLESLVFIIDGENKNARIVWV